MNQTKYHFLILANWQTREINNLAYPNIQLPNFCFIGNEIFLIMYVFLLISSHTEHECLVLDQLFDILYPVWCIKCAKWT